MMSGGHPLRQLRQQIAKEQANFEEELELYRGLNQKVPDDLISEQFTLNEKPCV